MSQTDDLLGLLESEEQKQPQAQLMTPPLQYCEELWDSLDNISVNSKKCQKSMKFLSDFLRGITRQAESFVNNVHRLADNFEYNMGSDEFVQDTTHVCLMGLPGQVRTMTEIFASHVKIAQNQSIEALENFCKGYSIKSSAFLQEANKYRNELKILEKTLDKSQNKYFKMCKKREKSEQEIERALQEHEKGNITFSQVQKKSNQNFDVKKTAEVSYHEYLSDLNTYNKMIEDSQILYKDWLNKMQDLDEQRVERIKATVSQFLNCFSETGSILKDKLEEAQNSAEQLNSQTDIKIFIDENRSKQEFFKKKDFVSYDYSKKMIERRQERIKSQESLEDFIDFEQRKQPVDSTSSKPSSNRKSVEIPVEERKSISDEFDLLGIGIEEQKQEKKDAKSFQQNKEFVYQAIDGLFKGKELDSESQLKIFELLHEHYVSIVIANYLHSINSPRKLESVRILKSLAEIIKYLITVSIHDKQNDFEIIHALLGSSQFIHAFDENSMRKILLTHLIRDHGIWQDISKWILWIYKVIENRRQDFVNKNKMGQRSVSDENESPQKKSTGQWFKGVAKLFINNSSNKDDSNSEEVTKNIIFNVLSQFIYHFANFGVTLEAGKKLIMYFCEKYSLDRSRIHTVLSEFDAVIRRGGHILTQKEKLMVPMIKRSERLKQFGYDNTTMVVGLVLPYIADDITLTNLLSLNSMFNDVFKDEVYKRCLINTAQGPVSHNKRNAIWSYFLNIDENVVEYKALRDKINENTDYIKSVDEVISMDVNRSYTNIKTLDQGALKNILRTYAFYNSEIKYCQGMNFLAGFLLMFYEDEETTFKAFSGLIKKFEMNELFKEDLPLLKEFFYKLDRLISMYLPDLYSHFKDECVQASLFSASWFITLFANTIQFQKSDSINEPLLKLWDYFMIYGFKGVFRAAIFLLKTFETCLYQLSFEQVLAFIPQMPRFIFVPNEEEEDQTTQKMIETLLSQSLQAKDNKIANRIAEIREKMNLNRDLHKMLSDLNISGFILEKLDVEYSESSKHSSIDNYLKDTE